MTPFQTPKRIYFLAFDHRGSLKKKLFGINGRNSTPNEFRQLADVKRLIWEGVLKAIDNGVPKQHVGVLVDEELGAAVAREAKDAGVTLAMSVEKTGEKLFDFAYGQAFGRHIEDFDPDFSKVLVRWNPDNDPDANDLQAARLRLLNRWLHDHGRRFLFELLVPPTDEQLALVHNNRDAYDTEVRPYLMLKAIQQLRDAGIEPDIWKIEGLVRSRDCELVADLIRDNTTRSRNHVVAVVLGRGAERAKVDQWLKAAAGVDAYHGFAIGRSNWWSGAEGFIKGTMTRDDAIAQIAAHYQHFVWTYERAEAAAACRHLAMAEF